MVLETLYYEVVRDKHGTMVRAYSAKGMVAVLLGDDIPVLLENLQYRFPGTKVAKAQGKMDPTVLDERGTPFQKQVWKALREIPYGETVTYLDIAKKIGRPKAARAVGGACGANPLAIVTPCHRVLASSGKLGGFGWGLDVKKKLLALEQEGS